MRDANTTSMALLEEEVGPVGVDIPDVTDGATRNENPLPGPAQRFFRKGLHVRVCVTLVTLTPPRAVFVFECDVTNE